MTKDRARKLAVRTSSASNYARAARLHTASTVQLHLDLARAFRDAGWPVEVEQNLLDGGMRTLFPGPTHVRITRGFSSDPSFDPDDPDYADLSEPIEVSCTAPPAPGIDRPEYVGFEVTTANATADDVVRRAAQELAGGRARAIAAQRDDAECTICGDAYPARHLLDPTASDDLPVCVACCFDGDLLPRAVPERLIYQLDRLFFEDLAAPAGASAVAALLACAAGPDLTSRLQAAWTRVFAVPLPHWDDPGRLWIWLPPTERPHALARFGAGASLRAVVEAVQQAHPDLHERFRRRLEEDLDDDPEDPRPRPDHLAPQLWDAVIAFAVTFMTQTQERNGHRAPWHVTESFEQSVLADHFSRLGSALDPRKDLSVIFTLGVGIEVVVEALGGQDYFLNLEDPDDD